MVNVKSTTALEQNVRKPLEHIRLHLQIAYAGVIVAAAALKHQNSERDVEVARVLEHNVGDRLWDQIERTAGLIDSLRPLPAGPAEAEPYELERVPLQ